MKMRRPTDQRGFSLAELMLVVALISITMGMAFYSASSGRGRSSAAAAQLAQELEMARAKALFDQNDFVVNFDTTTGLISVLDDNNSDGDLDRSIGETVRNISLSSIGSDVVFGAPAGLRGINGESVSDPVSFAADTLVFSARATADAGTIYLMPREDSATADKTHMRAISVSAATGRVKRWRYDANSSGPGPWKLER